MLNASIAVKLIYIVHRKSILRVNIFFTLIGQKDTFTLDNFYCMFQATENLKYYPHRFKINLDKDVILYKLSCIINKNGA